MDDTKAALKAWLEGDGQAAVGGLIKAGAADKIRRLTGRLENGNLFAHIDHEDRVALDKAQREYAQGDALVQRSRRRRRGMKILRALQNSTE